MRAIFSFLIVLLLPIASSDVTAQWMRVGLSDDRVEAFQAVGTNLFVGTNHGVFLSTDSGLTWLAKSKGLPFGSIASQPNYCQVGSFALVGHSLFAGIDNISGGGVFRTNDNGDHWIAANFEIANQNIFALSSIDTNLFAAGAHLFLSTNNGDDWTTNALPTNQAIYALLTRDSILFAGTGDVDDGGVFLSDDNGTNWVSASKGLPPVAVTALATIGSKLFAGIGDQEVNEGDVYISPYSGADWMPMDGSLPTNSGAISSLAGSDPLLFAGIVGGGVYWCNITHQQWISANIGLLDTNVFSVTVAEGYVFAGTDSGVYRCLLTDFGISSVNSSAVIKNSLTCYPNPFSESVTIHFTSAESGMTEVSVVNTTGKEVARIFSGGLSAGEHTLTWNSNDAPPGMYECLARINGAIERTAMILR